MLYLVSLLLFIRKVKISSLQLIGIKLDNMLKRISKLALSLMLLCTQADAQWLKKFESSDNLYQDAKREIELKHYQKAINMCNKALDISPKNMDIHLLLGRAYALAGKVDSGRLELNRVIEKNPKYRDAYIYLINMESIACNYVQAIEYADMGLKYFPNDRDILLKKLDVYNKEGNWIESNKLADYLFDKYSGDPFIRTVYLEYKLNLARQYSHKGYIDIAKRSYEAVLEQDPLNKEALQAVYNLDVRSGNYASSLAFTNRALQASPTSYEFMIKKVGILDAMSRYVDAIEVIEKLEKLYPNDPEVRKLGPYMRMQAGRYYMNSDPYLQFQGVLEKEPGNRDALNYVINIANSRGLNQDALTWVNVGLKKYPNDRELTVKKMGILTNLKSYGLASKLAEGVYRQNPTPDNKASFIELRMQSAKAYIAEQEYDSAINDLKSVMVYDKSNQQATSMMVNAYSQQKRYDDALHTIDDALTYYPGDEGLLFKKAGILESYQHYSEAAQISKDLLQRYPDKRYYLQSFVEQSLAAGRQSMAYDDYSSTKTILQDVLEKQPDNLDALNYIINIETAFKQYDSAIVYADQALRYYPDSKDLLFKKASIYADAHKYQEAYGITGALHNQFPYNIRFRDAYIDHLQGSGRQYMAANMADSALAEYYKALEVSPIDSNTLFYAINILNEQQKYDTALALIARGRKAYPDKSYFLLKRAVIYENQLKWDDAWLTADTLSKMANLDPKYMDYANYLFSRRLRNQWGVAYLRSKFDYAPSINHIATVQYTRRIKRGSITGRINYAGRQNGTGFQFEADAYYNHTPKWYSYGVAAYSPNGIIFPQYRLGYSIFHSFKHGYDGELGIRYLKADSGTTLSFLASVAKEYKDFYFNLRGYYINLNTNLQGATVGSAAAKATNFYSVILTARYYMNPISRGDWFSAIAGYGNAPDDFSRNYALAQLLSYPTVSCGAGYTKSIKYRTSLGMFFSWYNQKYTEAVVNNGVRTEATYHNQYDFYLQLLRRF